MISLDMKSETTTSSSPLSLSTPSDKSSISFSELLKGVSEKKDTKLIQNGSMILSLDNEENSSNSSKLISKNDLLLSLLKNEDTLPVKTSAEPLELNSELTSTLSTKEIKILVSDAKNYLKAKIESSDDFKTSQIKELPKTLKGLVEVAKTLGVDISKISVEEVKAHAEIKPKKEILEDTKSLITKEGDTSSKKEVKVQAVTLKEVIQDKKAVTPELKEVIQDKKAVTPELKEVIQDKKVVTSHMSDKEKSTIAKAVAVSQPEELKDIKSDEKFTQVQKEVKATPLFKAQSVVEHTTTEQLVQVKANSSLKVEQKTQKDRADETLKLLLRGEKPTMSNPALTADFSVATANVITPAATSDAVKSLEQLLHGESSSENVGAKVESLTTDKADSFEVKLNEAKQMIKYLSNDVKTAIEDYKSPFTRVKVQLNPQRLGEIDLTVVQRGKNIHVNISSNNSAINTLAMNANELRAQLNNSGINNALLNFNNSSEDGSQNASQQQQNHQKQKEAHEEYGILRKFENEEANEEILSSLEIIVPQYG